MRQIFRLVSLVLFVLVFHTFAAHAAGNLAADLQKTYEGIKALEADFTQVLVHKESGSREERTGVLHFKKPLLVRWETKNPAPELLLVAKDVIWNAFPDEEIAYKYAPEVAQDSSSIIRVITGQASLSQDFIVENAKAEQGLSRLILYPKKPTQSMVEAQLWIDPKTRLIKKLRIYDFYGNQNEMTFTRLDAKAKPEDALFTYTPPKGYLLEDRTQDPTADPATTRGKKK